MADLEDFIEGEELLAQIARLERNAVKSKIELAAAKNDLQALSQELEGSEIRLSVYEAATSQKPPKWLSFKKPKKSSAIAVAMLSDTHWDEVVKPEEVDFVNKYDRDIAEKRLRRFVEKTIALARDYISGPVEITGLTLFLGGDMVSGDIHEELTESNEGTMLETVVHWVGELSTAIITLADHFEKVHIAGVVGNHGRRTRKSRSKKRVRDNFDWLIYQSVSTMLKDDKRITWQIPEAADTVVKVHDTKFLLTHGDKVRGGGGVGGIWPPIKRMQFRMKANPQTAHDIMCIGHWHQLVLAPSAGLVVNGSPKGWDEYAATSGFEFHEQDTAQAFMLVTPENGVTVSAPIFCADRASEGW